MDYTRHSAQFNVISRTKPENYVYTDDEIHYWDELDERVRQLEENGVSDEVVANAVEKYLEENDVKVDLTGYATETYVNEKIQEAQLNSGDGESVDLSNYYTKGEVDAAIEAIELTPGPAGPQGEPGKDGTDGKDYVLTEADKAAIAQMAIELMPVAEEGAY